jgi:spoIIIJ-associated protein
MTTDPRETLETLLGLLGFFCEIEETRNEAGAVLLQVHTAEKDRLLGRRGEVLDDIQSLLNRMLQAKSKGAPKVQVDVEHYRAMQEDKLVSRVRELALSVRQTGRPLQLEPMNGYERRIVHNAFMDDPEVMTWSPPDETRLKRITLRLRNKSL